MAKQLTFEELAQNRGAVLVATYPSHVYENGNKTDTVDGAIYKIVFPALGYRECRIKVCDALPFITQEEINNALKTKDLLITCENFTAHWYRAGNEWKLTATASAVRLMQH